MTTIFKEMECLKKLLEKNKHFQADDGNDVWEIQSETEKPDAVRID